MRVLIFGLPGSGKTTLALIIARQVPCLYLNGDKVREIFKDNNFSMESRINQARRMRALADMAQNMLVIADFVCPTEKTREIFKPDLSIWMNTVDHCKYADTNMIFEPSQSADYVITVKEAESNSLIIIQRIKQLWPN